MIKEKVFERAYVIFPGSTYDLTIFRRNADIHGVATRKTRQDESIIDVGKY